MVIYTRSSFSWPFFSRESTSAEGRKGRVRGWTEEERRRRVLIIGMLLVSNNQEKKKEKEEEGLYTGCSSSRNVARSDRE